jgi:ABC-type transporter Mla subunit MlaD
VSPALAPEARRAAVDRLSANRQQLRDMLNDLAELAQATPEHSQPVIARARDTVYVLIADLGNVRDELGRLAR